MGNKKIVERRITLGIRKKLLREEKPLQNTLEYLRRQKAGYRIGAPPIFVVGCGHSGTSILLRLLGAHSRFYGVSYESAILFCTKSQQRLAFWLWNRNAVARRKHRWVEKTPRHVQTIDGIFATFPKAKVIFVVRDGRDATISMRKRYGEFDRGLKRWLNDNRSGLEWVDDHRVMMLKYEDLVKSYETIMPRVCEFIGEEFEEGMLSYHEQPAFVFSKNLSHPGSPAGKDHAQFRNWQINQKLFDGSGKWQKDMTEAEKTLFKQEALDLLIQFGYAESDN